MIYLYFILPAVILFFIGIRIVRPTQRALVEKLGKYHHFTNLGFHWIIPIIDRLFLVNVTEQMVDVKPQNFITNDNLNARVGVQVYFRVKSEEKSIKGSIHCVNAYKNQIVHITCTALRSIIGTLTLKSANSERSKINAELNKTLHNETQDWGIEIVRSELKEIDPSKDVLGTMKKVVKSENEKIAAIDSATEAETVGDGITHAKIKEGEGFKQSKILYAEGDAEASRVVKEDAHQYFSGKAQLLRRLEVLEISIGQNAKIVIPAGSTLVNTVGDMAGIAIIDRNQYQKELRGSNKHSTGN